MVSGARHLAHSQSRRNLRRNDTSSSVLQSVAAEFNAAAASPMDFWSRLLGGAGVQVGRGGQGDGQQTLTRFKRTYDQLRYTYERTPPAQSDVAAAETIQGHFRRLTSILRDEARSPGPHLCLSFAAQAQVYITVSRIGAVAQNENVIREAVAFFGALVDTEEEEFLSNERFAKYLMIFVDKTCGSGNLFVGEDTESEIVELLFGIAAKIRLHPGLLPVWFSTSQDAENRHTRKKDFVGVTSKDDFPLCYQLIDHVHHEGRMGDFSRTGLLYIFESASKSPSLEQWIVESDLPTLMASGLGALYSQLSRKLSILAPTDHLPMTLALSDYAELKAPAEAESLYSDYLQRHMETFLSYLLFWQDVLEHCRSVDVKQTLLDHFQLLFMEQLLYPSMLESSDMDGGSSVAVLTYIRRILESLESAELVDLILQYLLAISEDSSGSQLLVPRSALASRRRLSLIQMTQPENEDDRTSPSLFNLSDLLQTNVTSSNPQTVIAALQLSSILLAKDHSYCIDTLLQVIPTADATPARTHGALNVEVETYLDLAADFGGEAGLDDAYEMHLKDALRIVETHVCTAKLLSLSHLGVSGGAPEPVIHVADIRPHLLDPNGIFLTQILSHLSSFFTNNIDLNLSLTEAIITLASCPLLRFEGWLAVDPLYYEFASSEIPPTSEGDDQPDALSKIHAARRRPTWGPNRGPRLLATLETLRAELRELCSSVPDLRAHIENRKEAFRLHDSITDAMRSPGMVGTVVPGTGSGSQGPPSSVPARLLASGANSSLPSRSQSPRGRPPAGLDGQSRLSGPTSSPSPPLRQGAFASFNDAVRSPAPGSPARGLSAPRQQQRLQTPESRDLLDSVLVAADEKELKQRIRFPLVVEVEEPEETQSGAGEEESNQLERNVEGRGEEPAAPPEIAVTPAEERDEQGLTLPVVNRGRRERSIRSAASSINGDASMRELEPREASLSHIVTNAVLLQEFILELVAVMQVRAGLFEEVIMA